MKASTLLRGRSLALMGAALFATALSAPTPTAAQQASGDADAVTANHPYLADLLDAFDASHGLIYGAVLGEDGGSAQRTDQQLYQRLVRDVLANPSWSTEMTSEAPSEGGGAVPNAVPERVLEALDRANTFHRELLAIYADPDARAPFREVQALVAEYGSQPETAFLSDPKDLGIIADRSAEGAFQERYPNLHGLMWAHRWLQLASFEPLIRYQTPEQRRAGVMAVVARFWSMLENPPESFPTEMPMAPTIAPALVAFHPDAAAILDNANMYHDVVANTLVSQGRDPSGSLVAALNRFQDQDYMGTSWYNWNRMAILHGVGNQGGWATDIIPDPRHTDIEMEHEGGHMVIPGMPTEME